MSIYENLRKIREQRKIKQREVAKLLGMSTTNYSDIELGKVKLSIQDFIMVCEFLKIDPMVIIEGSNVVTVTLTPDEISVVEKLHRAIQDKATIQNVTINTGDVSIGNDTNVIIGKGTIKK